MKCKVIDAHHHLWSYSPEEFHWIDDRMHRLRCDFSTDDLRAAMHSAGVDCTVAVQARQTIEETRMLLAAADENTAIAGVVGWLPLGDRRATDSALAELSGRARLVGARHVVQSEAHGFLDDRAFNEGVARLEENGLAYDLLLHCGQLVEATAFVDRHPRQRFVLDHACKPQIASGVLEPWATQIGDLARREHVSCKLSGMVTEAKWDEWSLDCLSEYFDVLVEVFGTSRLMVGSDWPVCLVASGYAEWWQTVREYFAGFSAAEQEAVFGGNAARFYRLAIS